MIDRLPGRVAVARTYYAFGVPLMLDWLIVLVLLALVVCLPAPPMLAVVAAVAAVANTTYCSEPPASAESDVAASLPGMPRAAVGSKMRTGAAVSRVPDVPAAGLPAVEVAATAPDPGWQGTRGRRTSIP